jgi:hypothetical protein
MRLQVNDLFFRSLFSVRRECLDHLLILSEKQLYRVLRSYVAYFNQARAHQGIQQQIPELPVQSAPLRNQREKVIAEPVLGGLHHDYQRVAKPLESAFRKGWMKQVWHTTLIVPEHALFVRELSWFSLTYQMNTSCSCFTASASS